MNSTWRDLKSFIAKYFRELCAMGAVLTLGLFRFLYSGNYRIDSIIKLVTIGDEFNDLQLGRFGIVYLNRLLGLRDFTPYYMGVMTMLLLLAAGALLCFSIWRSTSGACTRAVFLLPAVVFLTPNWIEQLYFSYQSFLVVLGVVLVFTAVEFVENGKTLPWSAAAAVLAFAAFSIYQEFVPLYIVVSVGLVMLKCICAEDVRALKTGRSAVRHALVCGAALVLYLAVNHILQQQVESTTYLSSQVRWGKGPFQEIILSILQSFTEILTAAGKLDAPGYGLSVLFSAVLIAAQLIRARDGYRSTAQILGWLGMQAAGFGMIILLGSRTYIRTELAVTVVTALNFAMALALAGRVTAGQKKVLRKLTAWTLLAATSCSLVISMDLSLRLIYTDDVRAAFDERLTAGLMERLNAIGAGDGVKTVVFIGEPEVALDEGCIEGDVIGQSLYSYHVDVDSTNSIISTMLDVHGFSYRAMKPEELRDAELLAKDMPVWPAEGSVVQTGDVVTVKFSNDYYYDLVLLHGGYSLTDETVTDLAGGYLNQLEGIGLLGDIVEIRGYNIMRGVDARTMVNQVYLLDRNTNELYAINTACRQIIRPTKIYWQDGVEYDAGGFTANCPLSLFDEHPQDSFEILVKCTIDGKSCFVTLRNFINRQSIDLMPRDNRMEGGVTA